MALYLRRSGPEVGAVHSFPLNGKLDLVASPADGWAWRTVADFAASSKIG